MAFVAVVAAAGGGYVTFADCWGAFAADGAAVFVVGHVAGFGAGDDAAVGWVAVAAGCLFDLAAFATAVELDAVVVAVVGWAAVGMVAHCRILAKIEY